MSNARRILVEKPMSQLEDRKGIERISSTWKKYPVDTADEWDWLGKVSNVAGFGIRGVKTSNSANREAFS
jgi:hypothetical protein